MRKFLLALLLCFAVSADAATGTILGGCINRTGCFLYLNLQSLTTNGTYAPGTNVNNFKVALAVTTTGYDSTATYHTGLTRTVYATTNMFMPFNSWYILGGGVTGGPFFNGEVLSQAVTSATATNILDSPCGPLITTTNGSGSPDATHVWTGLTSGATYTPTAVPSSNHVWLWQQAPAYQWADASGNLWLAFSLSEDIKSGDTVVANIAAGLYTDAGANASLAASALTITNSSTLTNANPILRWNSLPGKLVASSMRLEAQAYHQRGNGGAPVACVVFTLADNHSHVLSATVTNLTLSQECPLSVCGIPIWNYGTTFSTSTLTDGDPLAANVTAYPWFGAANSTNSSYGGAMTNLCPLRALLDKTGARIRYGLVDPVNGVDGTGVVSATLATAAAHPFFTMGKAAAVGAALNGDGRADGMQILLTNGGTLFGLDAYYSTIATNAALVIASAPLGAGGVLGYISGPDVTRRYGWNTIWFSNLLTSGTYWCYGPVYNGGDWSFINCTNTGSTSIAAAGNNIWVLGGMASNSTASSGQEALHTELVMGTTVASNSTGQMYNESCHVTGCYFSNGCNAQYAPSIAITHHNVAWTFNRGVVNGSYLFSISQGYASGTEAVDVAFVGNQVEGVNMSAQTFSTLEQYCWHYIFWNNTFEGQRNDWQAGWDSLKDMSMGNWSVKGNSFYMVCWNDDEYAGSSLGLNGIPWLVSWWPNKYGVNWLGNNMQINFYPPKYVGINTSLNAIAKYNNDQAYLVATFPVTSQTGTFQQYEEVTFSTGAVPAWVLTPTSPMKVLLWQANGGAFSGTVTGSTSGAHGTIGTVTMASGGGDYHLQVTSPLRNSIPAGTAVLQADLDGIGYRNDGTDSAGALQYAVPVRGAGFMSQ